jgi:hypothetical protein
MFSDPSVVTYATVAKSLPRVGSTDTVSEYRLNDSGTIYDLQISHKFGTRNRFVARLQRDAAVTDPLVPAQNVQASMTATLTLDMPTFGLVAADGVSLAKALRDFLTDAFLLKLANGET